MEIESLAINLEPIGDIIDKNLCKLAAKQIKRGWVRGLAYDPKTS
jgi:Na+/phosphate symporter